MYSSNVTTKKSFRQAIEQNKILTNYVPDKDPVAEYRKNSLPNRKLRKLTERFK